MTALSSKYLELKESVTELFFFIVLSSSVLLEHRDMIRCHTDFLRVTILLLYYQSHEYYGHCHLQSSHATTFQSHATTWHYTERREEERWL